MTTVNRGHTYMNAVLYDNEIGTFVCIDCGTEFKLTIKHQRWFLDNGLDRPLRCEKCLEIKRSLREDYTSYNERGNTLVK